MNIKHIKKTHLDEAAVLGRSVPKGAPYNYADFEKKVVPKPWGHEYLMFRTPTVEVWHLFIKHSKATSLHCHPNKKTALIVLSGEVEMTDLQGVHHLKTPGGAIIDAGAFHQTRAISPEGAHVIEVETPPDKNDLIRLRDEARREHKAYEGSEMTQLSSDMVCVRFPHPKPHAGVRDTALDTELCIHHFHGPLSKEQQELLRQYDLAALLSGVVRSSQNNVVIHNAADLVDAKGLAGRSGHVFDDLLLLMLKHVRN